MKAKTTLYLRDETVHELAEYLQQHAPHLHSKSDAVEYLLHYALAHIVRETPVGHDEIVSLLKQQADRLAALLVESGKDAHRAARLVEVLSAQLLDDTHDPARIAEEARLHAVAHYTRRDLTGTDSSCLDHHTQQSA